MNSLDPRSLVPVATATLRTGVEFPFDLYLVPPSGAHPVLYRERKYPLLAADVDALRGRRIRTLYIPYSSLPDYEGYLRENVLRDGTASTSERLGAVREANRSLFQDLLRQQRVGDSVELAVELGQEIAEIVANHESNARELLGVLQHDYYTYTHVTNVCTYALLLAKELGIRGVKELHAIATGALLHDIGKRLIPTAVLNKKGRLDPDEIRIVHRHPITGLRDLAHRVDLSYPQLMMVYQHHERMDGSGYPVQLVGEEIHPWSRICAIADVFDAFTCYRPYRRPMPTGDVLRFLSDKSTTLFDAEFVSCWNSMLTGVV